MSVFHDCSLTSYSKEFCVIQKKVALYVFLEEVYHRILKNML